MSIGKGKDMQKLAAIMFALIAPLLLVGCNMGAGDKTIPLTITHNGKAYDFRVEVARTAEEQARGLMERTSLPENGGMLFPFTNPKIASFWMEKTLIPLDMIFIRKDGSIDRIAENTIPNSREPVVSGAEVSAVLELAGGTSARLGLDESATVTWKDSAVQ